MPDGAHDPKASSSDASGSDASGSDASGSDASGSDASGGSGGGDASSSDVAETSSDAAGASTTPYGTWHAIAAPPAGGFHPLQVWTGTEALFYDGNYAVAYDPVTDRWRTVATTLLRDYGAAWTGSALFVYANDYNASGVVRGTMAFFVDPITGKRTETSLTGRPGIRSYPLVAWAGDRILVLGGNSVSPFDGAQYDPKTDLWTPLPTPTGPTTSGAPTTTEGAFTVWTGSELLVWGGCSAMVSSCHDGWLYSPSKGTWRAMSTVGAMFASTGSAHAWTGSTLFLWGGRLAASGGPVDGTGGAAYSYATDTWTTLPTTTKLSARYEAIGAWTGSEFVVWSGMASKVATDLDDGARWDPALGVWKTMSIDHALPCDAGGSVWTGAELVVFCGQLVLGGTPTGYAAAWKP